MPGRDLDRDRMGAQKCGRRGKLAGNRSVVVFGKDLSRAGWRCPASLCPGSLCPGVQIVAANQQP
jgi:hypothetical protein